MSRRKLRMVLYGTGMVLAVGLLLAGFGVTFPPDPGTRLSGAALVAALGDYDGALAICETVLEEHPQNVEARVFRATFLAQAERYDEALEAYEDALAHLGDNDGLRRSLLSDRASVLLHSGRKEAFARAREELAREKVDLFVHLLDGMAARRGGDAAGAEAAFRRALAEEPDHRVAAGLLVEVLAERGKQALAGRRFAEALVAYRAAREIDGERVDLGLKTAEVHLVLEQEPAALRVLREIGLRQRGVAPLAFRAATALLERGEKERALEALATAVEADAQATQALFDKHPAWAALRRDRTLMEIVSERNSGTGGRLTAPSPVIRSEQDR